jgi:hypothetical protein
MDFVNQVQNSARAFKTILKSAKQFERTKQKMYTIFVGKTSSEWSLERLKRTLEDIMMHSTKIDSKDICALMVVSMVNKVSLI